MTDPAIICCALVGSEESPNPHHPRSFTRVVREGVEATQAGAAVLHVHALREDGAPTQDPTVYLALEEAIRSEAPDVLLNFTTGGSTGMAEDERLRSLEAEPDLASLDCGSMNFGDDLFLNPQAFIERAALAMRGRGIRPELECFEAGMVETARRLVEGGLVEPPGFFQLVLGVPGGAPARVDTLCHLASLLPRGAVWAATAVGRAHFPVMAATLALGGHVRTGLEDVAYTARGVYARSNAELVERAATLVRAVGRPVATPAQARAVLGI